MALSKNIEEYEDCRDHLDRAVMSSKGIRINMPSSGGAIHLRQRLYKFRQLEKFQSAKIYELGDARRGKTAYDALLIKVVGDSVEVTHGEPITVEEL